MTRRGEIMVVCLLLLGVVLWLLYDPPPSVPAPLTKTVDSLSATAPAFDQGILAKLADAERRAGQAESLLKAAGRERRVAEAQRSRADSLAGLARTSLDSGALPAAVVALQAALDARTLEATAWEARGDSLAVALEHQSARADTLDHALNETLVRLSVTTDVLLKVQAVALRGCRIGPSFASLPCPSRKQSVIGGAALGVAAMVLLRR